MLRASSQGGLSSWGTLTGADSAFYSAHQHSHHHPALRVYRKGLRWLVQQRGGGGGRVTGLQWGTEDSPSVPSGSTAQEVRAASRPAGTHRKTSPGSWRQGSESQGGREGNDPVPAKHRREGQGPGVREGRGSVSTRLLGLGTWLHRQDHFKDTERSKNKHWPP